MASAGGRITAGVGANLIGQHASDRNQEATCYVGNLDDQVKDELLWELFTQAGPVNSIYVPKDRVTNMHRGHAFVEFKGEEDADYAIKVLNMIKLFGKPIRVNKACQDRQTLDVGANLFVGNLDPDLDEKMLYDTFSAFGVIVSTPKIMRDPDTGISKGFGFVSFDNFEAADAAVEAMHGQFLANRSISVQYAFKKDSNERHGTPAERLMAQNYRAAASAASRPHTLFAAAPAAGPGGTVPAYPGMPIAPPAMMPPPGGAYGAPAPPSMPAPPHGHYGGYPPSHLSAPPPWGGSHGMPSQGYHSGGPPARPPPWMHSGGGPGMPPPARPPPPGMLARPPPMPGYGAAAMPQPPGGYLGRPPLAAAPAPPYPPQPA